jgi:hypothetical protein
MQLLPENDTMKNLAQAQKLSIIYYYKKIINNFGLKVN